MARNIDTVPTDSDSRFKNVQKIVYSKILENFPNLQHLQGVWKRLICTGRGKGNNPGTTEYYAAIYKQNNE